MLRIVMVLFLGCLAVVVATAQGYTFGWRHAVRLDYVDTGKAVIRPLELPLPKYDLDLVRAGIEGSATIQFSVDQAGNARDVKIVDQSQREFGDPSREAVTKWRFQVMKPESIAGRSFTCKFAFQIQEE